MIAESIDPLSLFAGTLLSEQPVGPGYSKLFSGGRKLSHRGFSCECGLYESPLPTSGTETGFCIRHTPRRFRGSHR